MDFFKLRKFRKAHKPNADNVTQDQPVPEPDEPKNTNSDSLGKSVNVNSDNTEAEDDDDDDFITNEVKRRLKELRRNSFMVLIPEETSPGNDEEDVEEEEQGETSSNEWRDVEFEGRRFWSGFDALYDIYCEHMLSFDRLISQQMLELGNFCDRSKGSLSPSTRSARSASNKLALPFRCLSLKNIDARDEETKHLQQTINDPYHDLETAYVAQMCLTWEALHCQYTQLCQKICYQPERTGCYNHSAQQFQHFQVLLQRFIENEPFEVGSRLDIYARTRRSLPRLLQVPKIQASDERINREEASDDHVVLATDLVRIIESSMLSFSQFVKMDKKKSNSARNVFGSQSHIQRIESTLEKKYVRLKDLWEKTKSCKKKSWPVTTDDTEILLGLIDLKVLNRVLRMSKISKEQLLWCEEKMKKLVLSDGKLQREPSPLLFPC